MRVEDVPDPQVAERATRRTYTAKYKASILAEYDGRTVTVAVRCCAARACTPR